MWFFLRHRVSPPNQCVKLVEDKYCLGLFSGTLCDFQKNCFLHLKNNKILISLRDMPFFYWSNVFLCFYPVFFISYAYLAQKLHEMNTPCTTIPPILCHFCLLYLLTCYYAMWVSSSKSSQPHENERAAVSRFIESAYWGCMSQCHYSNVGPGQITSTPISKANNQLNFTSYVVFPSPTECCPQPQLPKLVEDTFKDCLMKCCFLEPFVTF